MNKKRGESLDRQTLFDKRQTNIAKGVALLLLLCHHLFLKEGGYTPLVVINGVSVAGILSSLGKVCVAIFLFLSGYGLYKSFTKYKLSIIHENKGARIKSKIKYVICHLLKLLSDYWFVYIAFVPLGLLFGRSFLEIYHYNPLYFFADFFGLSYLPFKGEATMNATWWFMSIIIVYYIVFPLLSRIQEYSNELLLCIGIAFLLLPLPNFRELNTYLFPFVFGMYVSKADGIVALGARIESMVNRVLCCFLAVVSFACFRFSVFSVNDGLFGFSIIMFSFLVLSRIPLLNKVLEELGKYSGLIFMFHTFIIGYYFSDFIYWFKYPILIYLVTVVVCYLVARLLTLLKRVIKYDRLFNYLSSKMAV